MTLSLALLALSLVISFGVLLLNILTAPEGHEDENGFHATTGGEGNLLDLISGNQPKAIPVYAKRVVHHHVA